MFCCAGQCCKGCMVTRVRGSCAVGCLSWPPCFHPKMTTKEDKTKEKAMKRKRTRLGSARENQSYRGCSISYNCSHPCLEQDESEEAKTTVKITNAFGETDEEQKSKYRTNAETEPLALAALDLVQLFVAQGSSALVPRPSFPLSLFCFGGRHLICGVPIDICAVRIAE